MKPSDLRKLLDEASPGPWEANGTGAYVAMMSIIDDKIRRYVSAPQAGMCSHAVDIPLIAVQRNIGPLLVELWEVARDSVSYEELARKGRKILDELEAFEP